MPIYIDPKSKFVLVKIRGLSKSIERNAKRGLYEVGKDLKQTANNDILFGKKSGRLYRIKGRSHRASAPGESWANLSGDARRGLHFRVTGPRELIFGNQGPDYVKHLEDGTSKMAPRPAHLNAIEKRKGNTISTLNHYIRKSF